jgi:GntR family transcriptional regulator
MVDDILREGTMQGGEADGRPLYRQISSQILEKIANGFYPVGSLLPTEQEFCQEFGVSRYTVREAIRHLQSLGLVSKRQGQGTTVLATKVKLSSDMVVADEALAAELGVAEGEELLRLRSMRVPIDETLPIPAAWNETYILAAYSRVLNHFDSLEGPVYLLIERLYGETIGEIDQEISAGLADADLAKRLGIKARSAVLRIKRTYIGRNNRIVMIGYNSYAGDQFSVSMRIHHD